SIHRCALATLGQNDQGYFARDTAPIRLGEERSAFQLVARVHQPVDMRHRVVRNADETQPVFEALSAADADLDVGRGLSRAGKPAHLSIWGIDVPYAPQERRTAGDDFGVHARLGLCDLRAALRVLGVPLLGGDVEAEDVGVPLEELAE